jgi:hypothetical protein
MAPGSAIGAPLDQKSRRYLSRLKELPGARAYLRGTRRGSLPSQQE